MRKPEPPSGTFMTCRAALSTRIRRARLPSGPRSVQQVILCETRSSIEHKAK